MIDLLTAIQTKFKNDGQLAAAFPGGLWRDQAPEDVPEQPYLVSEVVGAPRDAAYGGSKRSQVLIQFKGFGPDHDAVGHAVELFASRFDDGILVLAGGAQNTDTRQVGDPMPNLMPHDAAGQDEWRWMVQFLFSITR